MEVEVVVEIPKGSHHKYEIDPASGAIWLDRVLSTATQYPTEYGFVVGTRGEDGDALDALVVLEQPTVPGCHLLARAIGVLRMVDEAGPDAKVLCVALGDPMLGSASDLDGVPPHLLTEIEHFFRVYKQLEPEKFAATSGWLGAAAAEEVIKAAQRRLASG